MQIILLERVENLGQMGDVVTVRPGYARNFLLPRSKALRATKENIAHFEGRKKALEADNLKKRSEAEGVAKKIDNMKVAVIRQASEAGQLYGSVTARDIADAICAKGVKVDRTQVRLDMAFKTLGLYPVRVYLHPEVAVTVTVNIARTVEEAELQEKKGGALVRNEDEDRKPVAAPASEAVAETQEQPAQEEQTA